MIVYARKPQEIYKITTRIYNKIARWKVTNLNWIVLLYICSKQMRDKISK